MESEDPDPEPGLEVDPQAAEGLREQMSKPLAMASSEKRSVTDPDARFLRERGGRFRLGYSGELAVSKDHFIVAARVTQQAADTASRLPMVDEVERHCRERPRQVLADSGFYSGANLDGLETRGIDGYVADTNLTAALKQGGEVKAGNRRGGQGGAPRLREKAGPPPWPRSSLYRQAMGEPVIGRLKQPPRLR